MEKVYDIQEEIQRVKAQAKTFIFAQIYVAGMYRKARLLGRMHGYHEFHGKPGAKLVFLCPITLKRITRTWQSDIIDLIDARLFPEDFKNLVVYYEI